MTLSHANKTRLKESDDQTFVTFWIKKHCRFRIKNLLCVPFNTLRNLK